MIQNNVYWEHGPDISICSANNLFLPLSLAGPFPDGFGWNPFTDTQVTNNAEKGLEQLKSSITKVFPDLELPPIPELDYAELDYAYMPLDQLFTTGQRDIYIIFCSS